MINKLNLSEETITILDNFNGLFAGIERDYQSRIFIGMWGVKE